MNDLKEASNQKANNQVSTEHFQIDSSELDISKLVYTIWQGKFLILGITLVFIVAAYAASYLVTPTWTATGVMTKPSSSDLGNLYQLQQNIAALDLASSSKENESSIPDVVYQKFTESLAAYDLKRLFWLQSDYFKVRAEPLKSDQEKAILLEDLIKNIQFTAKDERKGTLDTIQLKAESSEEANLLLRAYIEMVNSMRVDLLQQQFTANKSLLVNSLQEQIATLKETADASFNSSVKQAEDQLIEAQKAYESLIAKADADTTKLEQYRSDISYLYENLQLIKSSGPNYDPGVEQLKSQLALIQKQPALEKSFSNFHFLRTPQEPVKSDGPRRLFWAFLAGLMGGFVGVCTVLIRGTNRTYPTQLSK